jgi:hypothetical protein
MGHSRGSEPNKLHSRPPGLVRRQQKGQLHYDFNIFTTGKFVEKVQHIHRNPVTRGLVDKPEDYRWSSFNHYATGAACSIEIASQLVKEKRFAPLANRSY